MDKVFNLLSSMKKWSKSLATKSSTIFSYHTFISTNKILNVDAILYFMCLYNHYIWGMPQVKWPCNEFYSRFFDIINTTNGKIINRNTDFWIDFQILLGIHLYNDFFFYDNNGFFESTILRPRCNHLQSL